MSDVTRILNSIDDGAPEAAHQLLPIVYEELRRLATTRMAAESPGQTLQATALVHEAWLRLTNDERKWNGRTHFFAAAAEAMRRILVDNARRKRAIRNGGALEKVDLPDISAPQGQDQLFAIDEALNKLAVQHPQKADLVKLRYFVGMSVEEAAEALNISVPTAVRYWAYARAWLATEIKAQQ